MSRRIMTTPACWLTCTSKSTPTWKPHRTIPRRPQSPNLADNPQAPVELSRVRRGGRPWPDCPSAPVRRGEIGNGRPDLKCPRSVWRGRPKPIQHNVGELYALRRAASGVHLPNAKRLNAYNTHYVRPPLFGLAGCGAQGCAFCCQPHSRSSANTVPNLSTVLASS
ncbi:hypothetical protein [Xenorhabdus szentirmaii]|uniref:hypothetical protein n=1 Tax=Xenorhabdus szentirmaii TaxID=290112 RepID=UPI00117C3F4A|nr:hypothetical protein [Xenorhabdus szentirmaii]